MNKIHGLLIDYEFCTGCKSCEVTCKEEHNYPVGKRGIRVHDDGPWEIEEGVFNWNKIAGPTDLCDLCADRTSVGREPMCVHHCLANIISYGTVEELAVKLAQKPKQLLVVPQYKPLQAKGEFVSKNVGKKHVSDVHAEANTEFANTVHRSDARVELAEIDIVES